MRPGTIIEYMDCVGSLQEADEDTIWILTQDGMFIGVPRTSEHLHILSTLPPLTLDDRTLAQQVGFLSKEQAKKDDIKVYLNAGFIKIPEGHRYPVGTYKIIAGGPDIDKDDLYSAMRSIKLQDSTSRLTLLTINETHFIIKVPKTPKKKEQPQKTIKRRRKK